MLFSCQKSVDKKQFKQEVFQTEKAFEKMVADSSFAIAFYYFADSNAVILRSNDSIICGKVGIYNFYNQKKYSKYSLSWKNWR